MEGKFCKKHKIYYNKICVYCKDLLLPPNWQTVKGYPSGALKVEE